MRRVLEAYDAAATPVVLWPREHHSPGEVARSQGERINHPWKIVPYSLIMFQHAPSFFGPSVAGFQRRIAAQPVSLPCTSRLASRRSSSASSSWSGKVEHLGVNVHNTVYSQMTAGRYAVRNTRSTSFDGATCDKRNCCTAGAFGL